METQRSRGEHLGLGGVVVQRIGHVVPVVGGVAEVGTNLTIVVMIVAVAADALGGISPETHELRHGRSQATHNGVTARASGIDGTAIVIGIGLVPLRLAEIARAATAVARE